MLVKSQNLTEEKKTHPEHKYSVIFVSKIGTTKLLVSRRSPDCSDCLLRFYGAVKTSKT